MWDKYTKKGMIVSMFDAITQQLIKLTTEVGEVIMSYYDSAVDIEAKADNTPLTIADQSAHKLIVEGLNEITPGVPILTEESEGISYEQRSNWSEYWLIDPLDGTRDFLDKTGEFCICIAYIKNHKAIYGMVHAPVEKTHYYTTDNNETFRLNGTEITQLNTKDNHAPLEIVVGHHSINNTNLKKHLGLLDKHNVSKLGSALKFCRIAEGMYDYYPRFGPCSEWDTAAGLCILKCAGGSVVDDNGKELRYNTKDDLTSPVFFASNKA